MRIAFTGGGTGGHIFPNIAVIRELDAAASSGPHGPGHLDAHRLRGRKQPEVFYVGAKNSLEEKIIKTEGIDFFSIHAGKLRRYFDMKNFIDAFKVPLGIIESYRILRRRRPNLVFAKGGYVSVPVVIAARLLKIPVWIHESDLSPGLATKISSRFADKIWLSFEESRKFFPHMETEVSGNPIRKEIFGGKAEKARAFTGFSKNFPVILFIGGSSGAMSLNALIYKILPKLLTHAQVVHITGPSLAQHGTVSSPRYRPYGFINEELADVYALCDLVVSRAGSGSLFEILAVKKPMILVPLPGSASRGDQMENAKIFEYHGWARRLDQEKLTPEIFLREILEFLKNKKASEEMMNRQSEARLSNAAAIIAEAMSRQKT